MEGMHDLSPRVPWKRPDPGEHPPARSSIWWRVGPWAGEQPRGGVDAGRGQAADPPIGSLSGMPAGGMVARPTVRGSQATPLRRFAITHTLTERWPQGSISFTIIGVSIPLPGAFGGRRRGFELAGPLDIVAVREATDAGGVRGERAEGAAPQRPEVTARGPPRLDPPAEAAPPPHRQGPSFKGTRQGPLMAPWDGFA